MINHLQARGLKLILYSFGDFFSLFIDFFLNLNDIVICSGAR